MRTIFSSVVRPLTQRLGFDIVRFNPETHELNEFGSDIYDLTKKYTMTSRERIMGLVDAVKYLEKYRIEGSFVECGVWKGGSSMAMAYALNRLGSKHREIYLYDTFSGMPVPTDIDVTAFGSEAGKKFEKTKKRDGGSTWCLSTINEVKENMKLTGYPADKVEFIKGKVEDTIPKNMPAKIALLRLDTDWYESTKHELTFLWPRLIPGGVLILDDYGHWRGARQAVDEYLEDKNIHMFLIRIDDTGRIAVKT